MTVIVQTTPTEPDRARPPPRPGGAAGRPSRPAYEAFAAYLDHRLAAGRVLLGSA